MTQFFDASLSDAVVLLRARHSVEVSKQEILNAIENSLAAIGHLKIGGRVASVTFGDVVACFVQEQEAEANNCI